VKVGDLVIWPLGYCETPGLVLETRPAKKLHHIDTTITPMGLAVLIALPELGNYPEWFHEREVEIINE